MTHAVTNVALDQLTELWIHTGTACNLECPFCLEGSRPGDTRLERIKLNEIKPYLDEAVLLGVQRFGFTGGEPLIVKDMVKILEYALNLKPCLVLSNGTAPLLKRLHQLQLLKQQKHSLSFRISIDYPDQQRHDTARGWGNFARAIEGLQLLHAQGFAISIARQMDAEENTIAVAENYRRLLRKASLPETTRIIALPELGRLGTPVEIPLPGPLPQSGEGTTKLMCTHSRMLLKRNGQLRVHACAFTDDDLRFDLGQSLVTATQSSVCLQHQRCGQCVKHAASYSEP
jgi:sulfatase maturation enzyme AslB (radical SAM superfamily)